MSNFRKSAIATLKQLRSEGYTLNIDLRASDVALKEELERLECAIAAEICLVRTDLAAVNFNISMQDDLPWLDAVAEEPEEELPADDAVMAFYDCLPAAEAAAERLDGAVVPAEAEVVTASAERQQRRAVAAYALGAHLFALRGLLATLFTLVLRLPVQWTDERLRGFEGFMAENAPDTVRLLVWVGDRARAIDYGAVMDRVFCLA